MPIYMKTQDRPMAIPYSPSIQQIKAWIHKQNGSRILQETSNQSTKMLQWKAKDQRNVILTCRE